MTARYELDLNLPGSVVRHYELPSNELGYTWARSTKLDQAHRLNLHPFRKLPHVLFGIGRLPIDLLTIPLGRPWLYGADDRRVLTVHR